MEKINYQKSKIIKDGKCSYCDKKIEKKYKSCYLCNKKRLVERPIIPNCADCGKKKDSIYKYCVSCYPRHANEWKEKKNIDNNNEL